MYRVYYLVPNLQQVRNAITRLDTAGIGGERIHVMARDAGELVLQDGGGVRHRL